MTIRTDDRRRVEAGAAWLDHFDPNWINMIDLPQLELSSATQCVLGQIVRGKCSGDSFEDALFYDGFGRNLDDLRVEHAAKHGFNTLMIPYEVAKALGFHTYSESFNGSMREYVRLTAFWIKLIEQRRAA